MGFNIVDFFIFLIIGTAAFSILATGVSFTEKSGVINIGVEGSMIFGALGFALTVRGLPQSMGDGRYLIGLLSGMLLGLGLALLHGLASITANGDHIISGTALNILAGSFSLFVINQILKTTSITWNDAAASRIAPNIAFSWVYILYFVIAIIVVLVGWFMFKRTKFGIYTVASGENPRVLEKAGINVKKIRWMAVIISGVLAGLAGGMVTKILNNFFVGNVRGFGFIGIAITVIGGWKIIPIVIAAFGFSFFYGFFQQSTIPGLNPLISTAIIFLFPIVAMVLIRNRSLPPAMLGQSYRPPR